MATKGTGTTRAKKVTAKEATAAEEKQLRGYEMVLILNPELTEDKFNASLDNFSKLITDMGGAIAEVQQWGKRKLAYPIKQFSEGNYVLTRFQLQPAMSKDVEAKLHISEDILRHLLVRLDS